MIPYLLTIAGAYLIGNSRYADGGLIAPNGKKSNLTPEQYKLVRSSEFKAWFGDWENDPESASKVVDENGEPLVCYHGSRNEFNEFKINEKSHWDIFWFSPNYETAKMHAEDWDSDTERTPTIYKCFLNVRKLSKTYPFDLKKYDGFIDYKNEMDYINWKQIKHIQVVQVVNSNQIKLADGSNTTFDSSNSDIRFAKGGKILKAEDMLKHPLTIERLNDLDDEMGLVGESWWADTFHAKTINYKPNTYYHLNTGGLNAGVGKGLYLGRDKDALIAFYDVEQENKTVDTYVGNPNWLDLIDYKDYELFEEQAVKKYGKPIDVKSISDIDIKGEMIKKLAIDKGYDGIRYYDPQSSGEEFVLFNTKKVKKL